MPNTSIESIIGISSLPNSLREYSTCGGVEWNTPGIIKYPFMRMTYNLKDAFYVCVNKGFNRIPEEIKDRSIVLNDDINLLVK